MPMNMGIHRKLIGHGYGTFLDSRSRGKDGGMLFSENALLEFQDLLQRDFNPFRWTI